MTGSDVVWEPPAGLKEQCTLTAYANWLAEHRGLRFGDYQELWRWSITELDAFWRSVWDFFGVADRPAPDRLLFEERMPGARWGEGETLNYAEQLLRRNDAAVPALIYVPEQGPGELVFHERLASEAAALAARLRALGVERGDTVVGYLGNTPEAIVGLLACASIGAIWNVCAPEFGTGGVLSRFGQLAPKVMIATVGYEFSGKYYDRCDAVEEIARSLPPLRRVILVDRLGRGRSLDLSQDAEPWVEALATFAAPQFEQVPFEHPLWVLFSSGTTGTPKGITQSHGGVLLEHLKVLGIMGDLRPGDRYMLLGSTSWMVWNVLVSALLVGATVVLVDGNPTYPDLGRVWDVADRVGATAVGFGAGYLHACQKAHLRPRRPRALRSVLSTGSPLSPAAYRWVADSFGSDVWLISQSGGTDVCSAFVGGCPWLPVRLGRIQAPLLGVAVGAWDAEGGEVIGERGELVITRPMPSMPLYLWGDADGTRYRDSYFSTYPGVWRHGDFVEFDADGSSVILGRSDSTLNRNGVRMGSADIYQTVEGLPEVREALVVGVELSLEGYYMPLFVELADGVDLERARGTIVDAIRYGLSPRHVPDDVIAVPGIPHTKTGKKLEVPIKRLLQGATIRDVVDPDAVDRADLLEFYSRFAADREAGRKA